MPVDRSKPRWSGVYQGEWTGLPGWPPSAWAVRIAAGRPVSFSRSWRGHLLSGEQCRTLMAGGCVTLPNPRPGEPDFRVVLGEYLHHGQRHCGVAIANAAELTAGVPGTVNGVRLDAARRRALEEGRTVHVEGLESRRTGRRYDADLRLADDGRGRGHLVIEHPASWRSGRTPEGRRGAGGYH